MGFKIATFAAAAANTDPNAPIVEEEEFYSSWSLFLVCTLLILSLLTSYYLQIKRIRAVHETLVSIFAGMFVGLIIRLAPGTMIREMLVSRHSTSSQAYWKTGAIFFNSKALGLRSSIRSEICSH